MNVIVLPDEHLQRLERRFGPDVRRMGPWCSDGVFGYLSIPFGAVETAAEAVGVHNAASRLKDAREPAVAFVELLETSGPDLIARLKNAYAAISLAPPYRRPAVCSDPAARDTVNAA